MLCICPNPQWTDAFQPDRGDGRSDVAFEKAALLFNLGAISSQVALGADLGSERGVKNAARSYQVPPSHHSSMDLSMHLHGRETQGCSGRCNMQRTNEF